MTTNHFTDVTVLFGCSSSPAEKLLVMFDNRYRTENLILKIYIKLENLKFKISVIGFNIFQVRYIFGPSTYFILKSRIILYIKSQF